MGSLRRSVLTFLVTVVPLVAAADEPGLTLVDHGVPEELTAGMVVRVPLVLRNDGPEAWTAARGYAVSYHWLGPTGEPVEWDGRRSPLPEQVDGGATISMEAVVAVPAVPGAYRLQWDVVQEQVRWLSDIDASPPPQIPVLVRAGHAMSVVTGGTPRWLAPDERLPVSITVRNDGSSTWRSDGSFAVSYHWLDRGGGIVMWDGVRSPVPSLVLPGEEVMVEARVQAPTRAGLYRLQWDLVEEGVTWLSERDPSPEPGRLVVVADPPIVTPAMLTLMTVGVVMVIWLARRRRPEPAMGVVCAGDLVWLAGVLFVTQRVVLAEAGTRLTADGRLLTVAGVAAVLLALLVVPRRVRPWASWVVGLLAVLLLFTDLLYQRFYGDILSAAVVQAGRQVATVRESVWSLALSHDLWLWAQLGSGLLLVLLLSRCRGRVDPAFRIAVVVVLLGALLVGLVSALRLTRSESGVLQQVFRSITLAREVGVLNFHAIDVGRRVVGRAVRKPLAEEEFEEIVGWFRDRGPRREGRGEWFGTARGYDLLMIQVESLQAFVIGFEINGQQVTPSLNRWVEGAVTFANVTDQTAQGRSSDSELATQVSLLPPPVGTAAFLYPNNQYTGIAEILAEHGYRTLSAVPFDGGFWNRRLTHHSFGYQDSLFRADFGPGEKIGWGLNDRGFLSQMVPRLGGLERPYCAWLLTLSLHHPFTGFPDHHKVLDLAEWEGTPFGNFLHTMSFFDRAFEEMVAGMEAAGLADRTVVVLWGDHDAGLEWNPEFANTLGHRPDAAGWYLSQRVPLMIRVPEVPALVGERNIAAGHQDVAPTLLALLGIDPAPYPFVGRNLLGDPGDVPVVGEYQCWRDNLRLYLSGGPTLTDGECYELTTMEEVDTSVCAGGFVEARRQVEVSLAVLEYDLQQRIHDRLVGFEDDALQ
jgi:phosphoglycerol transferase MdoB-like AlkP superfamily enzyme